MKIATILLAALLGWLALREFGGGLNRDITELTVISVTAALATALLGSMALAFVRSGKIRLEDKRLVVSTALGFYAIPYWQIDTIRRCRRRGESQRLQVIYHTLGERKILEMRPGCAAQFAALLREKCPRLSSSSDVVLVRQSGQGKLIHAPRGRRIPPAGEDR